MRMTQFCITPHLGSQLFNCHLSCRPMYHVLRIKPMARPLRILIVSAEIEPIASTGELGRSVGGLAKSLKKQGIDVRVVIPKYRDITTSFSGLVRLVPKMEIRAINRFGSTAICRDELPGEVPVYLIEKDKYFDREYFYGTPEKSYEDNAERFSFFNLAALEMFTQIGFYPDVIHCHDWHTGLIPAYLETLFHNDPLYAPIKTLFTVHDLLHQGCFPREELAFTGLPESVYTSEGIEFYGKMSFLKSGLVYADILSTESKRYSQEIQTEEHGRGFEKIFQKRSKDLYGVINGVDYKQYDPRIDPHIIVNYTKDELEEKQECKQDLLKTAGLEQNLEMPLVGMIVPLDEEKGIELLTQVIERMMAMRVQFVLLNDEDVLHGNYVKLFNKLTGKYEKHMRCYAHHDEPMKHKILAGVDILLMPSKSEPCGVTQMYALKYGTIPFVRATGGLDDTIVEFSPESGKGTGFKFEEYTSDALLSKLQEVLTVYHNRSLWELLQMNAMRVDYSWMYTAKKYLDLYKLAINKIKIPSGS